MRRTAWLGAIALIAAAAAAPLLHRPHDRLAAVHRRPATALPGVTLDGMATPEGERLVVTSTRSGTAGGPGLQVGDRIEDVDGLPAPSLSALRAALDRDHAATLQLHVRRADRLLTVPVDRPARCGYHMHMTHDCRFFVIPDLIRDPLAAASRIRCDAAANGS